MDFMIQPMEIGSDLGAIWNKGCNGHCPNTNCVPLCACPPGDDS